MIYRKDTGEILGVHIFGLHAADLIHEASNAVALGQSVRVRMPSCFSLVLLSPFTMRCMVGDDSTVGRGARDCNLRVQVFKILASLLAAAGWCTAPWQQQKFVHVLPLYYPVVETS
jgi:hypothetical protein